MPLFGKPDISKLEAKQDIKGLVKLLTDASQRRDAQAALARIGAPAVKPMLDAVKGDTPVVVISAIMQVLTAIGKPAVGPLNAVAAQHKDASVRALAADMVRKIG